MARSLTSTDSSKTLSITNASGGTPALTSILTLAPHEFLQPSGNAIQDAALNLVKRYFDPLLKNGGGGNVLDSVYLEGFDVEQVWEQVRGVVEMLAKTAVNDAKVNGHARRRELENGSSEEEEEEEEDGGGDSEVEDMMMVDEGDENKGDEEGEEDKEGEEEGEEEFTGFGEEDGGVALEGGTEDGVDFGPEDDGDEEEDPEAKELIEDIHGLNDGFFSIDDFNRQTELLELQDARGGPVDEDDDDDIDFHADPAPLQDEEDEEGEEEEEAAAPTNSKTDGHLKDHFEGEDDDEMDLDKDMDDNANDIMYEDFFAPPAKKKKSGKPKDKKRVSWRQDVNRMDPEAEFDAVQSDMDRVRRDLFAEEDEESDEDVKMDGDPVDPMNRRSAHQKRRAALMEQIRELEAENVARKQWVMGGEAKARDRPLNSLLEEDLDFERSGKPVPVITQEVTEGLEDMIKRRILVAQFDEVVKRRPGDITDNFRRGRVELDDSKPQESLAEVYEKEHLKTTNPEDNPEASDEKLQEEHKEIEAIWSDVSRKLDALTSWHFTPKPPKPSLAIVSDVAAISMEEAQPSAAAGGVAANVSMLAPQEIYNPGKDKAYLPIGEGGGREIAGKSGAPVSTREMTSDERKRRRRREKEKIRKRNAAEGVKRGEVKAGSKKDVMDTLKRGNVAVIGKGGEKKTVDGKAVTEKSKGAGASFLKL